MDIKIMDIKELEIIRNDLSTAGRAGHELYLKELSPGISVNEGNSLSKNWRSRDGEYLYLTSPPENIPDDVSEPEFVKKLSAEHPGWVKVDVGKTYWYCCRSCGSDLQPHSIRSGITAVGYPADVCPYCGTSNSWVNFTSVSC